MKKYISIGIEQELYDKFILSLLASGQNEEEVISTAIRKYISEQFQRLTADNYILSDNRNIILLKQIKAETHQSWVNLRKAIRKRKNLPYSFGTVNVEASAEHFLNRILRETTLSIEDILRYLDENKLGW